MDKQEFLKQQYISLREEVKETKDRIFKTMGYGLVVVPASHTLAQSYNIETITLSLPILVIVVSLIFLAENNALMRCGRFIKHHIEPGIKDCTGWEEWLEMKSEYGARNVDKYLAYAFYLLFFVYFAGSVFLAAKHVNMNYGIFATSILLGVYIAIGVWFIIYLIQNIRVSTTTAIDNI